MAVARAAKKTRGFPATIAGIVLLIFGIALLGLGASTAMISRISPPQFEAAVTIRAEPAGSTDAPTNSISSEFYFLHTEFEVIRSEMILDPVITNLDLPQAWSRKAKSAAPLTIADCRAVLKQRMDSTIHRGTNVFELLVRSDDRAEAATLANAIADSYLQYRVRQRLEHEAALTNVAQAQLAAIDAQIEAARENALELKKGLGNSAKPENSSALIPSKSDAVIDKQSQLVNEEQTLARLKTMDRQRLRSALPGISPDAVLITLLEDLNRAELNASAGTVTNDQSSSNVVQTTTSIDELNQKIDRRVAGILLNLDTHIAVLKDEIRQTEASAEAARRANVQNDQRERPYNAALQRVHELEIGRNALQTQNDALIKAAEIRTAKILDQATPPIDSVPGNVFLRPILFFVGGLLALSGLVLLIRSQRARLGSP